MNFWSLVTNSFLYISYTWISPSQVFLNLAEIVFLKLKDHQLANTCQSSPLVLIITPFILFLFVLTLFLHSLVSILIFVLFFFMIYRQGFAS